MNNKGSNQLSFLGYGAPTPGAETKQAELDAEMELAVWATTNKSSSPTSPNNSADSALPDEECGLMLNTDTPEYNDQIPDSTKNGGYTAMDGERRLSRHMSLSKPRKYSLQEGLESRFNHPYHQSHRGRSDGGYGKLGHSEGNEEYSMYVQLDELGSNATSDNELAEEEVEVVIMWHIRARWIKYEEDMDELSGRWGKPHVAPLCFHSLLSLRRCLQEGIVELDVAVDDLEGAASFVASRLKEQGRIHDAEIVEEAMLLPRSRHPERSFRLSIGARHASLQSLADGKRRRSSYALPPESGKRMSLIGWGDEESILKCMPEGSEGARIMVGILPIKRPIAVFMRLSSAVVIPQLCEPAAPMRFLFMLVGPSGDLDYHEVGRSLGTLLANPSFRKEASSATDRQPILSAMNVFLDDSIVLPLGDWERQALLPIDELRARANVIQRRKRAAAEKQHNIVPPLILDEKKALIAVESGGMPPKEPTDPLTRTGRLYGGVIRDIRRRYPYYLSDITDALNGQCAAAVVFMYFAALSSAITFGGLIADKTYGATGISETLLLTSAGGAVFSLLAGQPLMITGTTGPLLLLDTGLAQFCKYNDWPLLTARMYASFWLIAIALAVAAFEGSVAVRFITRFTEDIFAFLIALIFISEPVTALVAVYRANPLQYIEPFDSFTNVTDGSNFNASSQIVLPPSSADFKPHPNTALFCTMLTLGTFALAYYLRIFRNGQFLGRSVRRALGDFGVPLSICAGVGLAYMVPVWTENLHVPPGLTPTASRPWLVLFDPLNAKLPGWAAFAMVLPALMVYIIVFMETHIAELIVDKPERNLKKGSGFHMDIVIISLVNVLCGLMGAPWQCVATVRSVSHVAALTVFSRTHAPGDKPYIVEVKEQRLTGFLVSLMVGVSVLASGILSQVPISVLCGVFLYMGVSSLAGIQFWDRCILLLKPVKHHPPAPYVRLVQTYRMHAFTAIQICTILGLYFIKSSSMSLFLPFFLALTIPLRYLLGYVFTQKELQALDGAQQECDKEDEPDFYEEATLPPS